MTLNHTAIRHDISWHCDHGHRIIYLVQNQFTQLIPSWFSNQRDNNNKIEICLCFFFRGFRIFFEHHMSCEQIIFLILSPLKSIKSPLKWKCNMFMVFIKSRHAHCTWWLEWYESKTMATIFHATSYWWCAIRIVIWSRGSIVSAGMIFTQ